jgi:excisionase family DNA binding protein
MNTISLSDAKIAYRINEAAEAIGLSRSSLYELAKEGKLSIRKVYGRSLILREDLIALVRGETV